MAMKDIFILTDYKGYFGSKQKSSWYQSGMDLDKLKKLFYEKGYHVTIRCFSDIDFRHQNYKDKLIIYTSSEDPGYYYKDYIEDIVLGLHYQGAILIPRFEFLRANNNKVFMEIIRDLTPLDEIHNIKSEHFGTIGKLKGKANSYQFPLVIKSAKGAMSSGVFIARNAKELIKKAKKISRTPCISKTLWEIKNYIKLSGRIKFTSWYRNKFIVQNFAQGLSGDWKVLIYGNIYYVLRRQNRKNDFKASGSGIFSYREDVPKELLNYADKIIQTLDLPHLSLDIGYNGKEHFLIEMQAVYFGSKTLEFAPFFFMKNGKEWEIVHKTSDLEEVYVESLCNYLDKI